MNLYITLLVLLAMIIAFATKKVKYGVIVMTCITVLCLTGVIDVKTAFSGFSNTTTVLCASMFVMAGAISRTNVAARLKVFLDHLGQEHEFLLLLALTAVCFVLTIFVGQTACMCIMFVFVANLSREGRLTPARMIFFSCAINAAWFGRIPFGINASLPMTMNSFYQGVIGDNTQYQLGYFDVFTGSTITAIALTIWSLFAIRFLPTHDIDSSIIPKGIADKSLETKMPLRQEITVFVLFIVMCVGFLFSNQLGNYMYIIPVACVLLVYYFKIMSLDDIVHSLTSDMIWLVAGMTVMSTALGDSGAAQLLGNAVLAIVGSHPAPFVLCLVLGIATMIPANFTSHIGCMAIMSPIAASIALAGGMNPVTLVLVVFNAACAGIAFPSGNSGAMIAFGVGDYNPVETWKFTIPYLVIAVLVGAITIPMFFPLY